MNIVFDITHPAHVHFFKNVIKQLANSGVDISILTIKRGDLEYILTEELGRFNIKSIGEHKGSTRSVIIDVNLKRFINLFTHIFKQKIDLGVSVGGHV